LLEIEGVGYYSIMMIETLVCIAIAYYGEAATTTQPSSNCAPDEVCYPIDPNPPKTIVPPNCFFDAEGNLTCNPIDPNKTL